MKTKTWRYLIGFFLILLGGLMLLSLTFSFKFWGVLFGIMMIVGGGLFLLPIFRTKANWWALLPGLPLVLMGIALVSGAVLPIASDLVGTGFLLGIGIAFLITFLLHNHYWWALIPGTILTGIGAATVVEVLFPRSSSNLVAFIVLGSIGLAFLLVFFVKRSNWWAIIPAGVLASVAALVLTGLVGLLFVGFAVTFALIPLLVGRQHWWAWIVCAVMAVMGVSFLFFETALGTIGRFFLPILLIVLGIAAIVQVMLPKKK
ncbi:MAG: hypothetical protein V2J07_03570 [Anaerolineae bacterium]|jgi:hypothetical protein|nr:hypothetical protein [Anaerolineae bacterium]